jgi:hypothetical protein
MIRLEIPADHPAATRAARAFFNTLLDYSLNDEERHQCGCATKQDHYDAAAGPTLGGDPDYRPESFPGAADDCLTFNADEVFGQEDVVVLPFTPQLAAVNPLVPPAPPLTATNIAANITPEYNALPPAPPAAPAPPAVVPVSGVKLDAEGLPWDRRIHASTKTMRQSDGTWKLIRGVADSLVTKVKAELQLAMGQVPVGASPVVAETIIATVVTPPAPPLPNLDDNDGFPLPPGAPIPAAVIPPAPPVLTLVPPPAPPAPPAADPFPEFVQFCTGNQQSGKLKYDDIVSTCQKYGITQLPMLNARHDLIPTIRAELESLCQP